MRLQVFAGQTLSSITNFVPVAAGISLQSPDDFAALSLAIIAGQVCVGFVRHSIGDVFLTRDADDTTPLVVSVADGVRGLLIVPMLVAAVGVAFGLLLGPQWYPVALAGLLGPLPAYTELLRSRSLARREFNRVILADALWLLGVGLWTVMAVLIATDSGAQLTIALTLGLPMTSIVMIPILNAPRYREIRRPVRDARVGVAGAEFLVGHLGLLAFYAAAEWRFGSDAVGQVRAAITLFAPATVLLAAARTVGLMEARSETSLAITALAHLPLAALAIFIPSNVLPALGGMTGSLVVLIAAYRLADVYWVAVLVRLRRNRFEQQTLLMRVTFLVAGLGGCLVLPGSSGVGGIGSTLLVASLAGGFLGAIMWQRVSTQRAGA